MLGAHVVCIILAIGYWVWISLKPHRLFFRSQPFRHSNSIDIAVFNAIGIHLMFAIMNRLNVGHSQSNNARTMRNWFTAKLILGARLRMLSISISTAFPSYFSFYLLLFLHCFKHNCVQFYLCQLQIQMATNCRCNFLQLTKTTCECTFEYFSLCSCNRRRQP